MPKSDGTPEKLRPYLFHGVDLDYRSQSKDAVGECPWCGKEGKFSVSIATGQWRCFSCNEGQDKEGSAYRGGNAVVFLRMLWDRSIEHTTEADYTQLANDRKLLNGDTLLKWGAVKSSITGDWLVPGYNADRSLTGLYKYTQMERRKVLLATPTMGLPLFGIGLWDASKPVVYLCEGPWDGMALWEVLGRCKETDGGLTITANEETSLLHEANVIAVAGTSAFYESWLPLFKDKIVVLMYDNDHPRTHPKTGEPVDPAGLKAAERVSGILSRSHEPPAEIHYLQWSAENGYNLELPSGHDVRDYLTAV